MNGYLFAFLVVYVSFMVIGVVLAVVEYSVADDIEARKYFARLILLMPIWPVAAVYGLLRYGIPFLMHWTGKLFVDATRDLEQQL